jgi:hypothetical protein
MVLSGLVPEGGDDRRIDLSAGSRFNRSFTRFGVGTCGGLDRDLRVSGIFDSILDPLRQFPPIQFARRAAHRLMAIAGTNDESQKENKS